MPLGGEVAPLSLRAPLEGLPPEAHVSFINPSGEAHSRPSFLGWTWPCAPLGRDAHVDFIQTCRHLLCTQIQHHAQAYPFQFLHALSLSTIIPPAPSQRQAGPPGFYSKKKSKVDTTRTFFMRESSPAFHSWFGLAVGDKRVIIPWFARRMAPTRLLESLANCSAI